MLSTFPNQTRRLFSVRQHQSHFFFAFHTLSVISTWNQERLSEWFFSLSSSWSSWAIAGILNKWYQSYSRRRSSPAVRKCGLIAKYFSYLHSHLTTNEENNVKGIWTDQRLLPVYKSLSQDTIILFFIPLF